MIHEVQISLKNFRGQHQQIFKWEIWSLLTRQNGGCVMIGMFVRCTQNFLQDLGLHFGVKYAHQKGTVENHLQRHEHKLLERKELQLWAKLIHSGHHDDYDTPTNIPLITGKDMGNSKKTV